MIWYGIEVKVLARLCRRLGYAVAWIGTRLSTWTGMKGMKICYTYMYVIAAAPSIGNSILQLLDSDILK